VAALAGARASAARAEPAAAQPAPDRGAAADRPAALGDAARVAEPEPVAAAPAAARPPLGFAALPGGLRAPLAATLPRGVVAVTALGGGGSRSGLVAPGHRLRRGLGELAIAYAPARALAIALVLEGRYDRHAGVMPAGDDNYTGDPRLVVRAVTAPGAAAARAGVMLGGQLTLWAPGGDAPSIALDAVTAEARALAAVRVGGGRAGASVGVRLDRSRSAVDDPAQYRVHERASLGLSAYHAVVGSASIDHPLGGRAFAGGEVGGELYLGAGAPGPLLRAGVRVGVSLTRRAALSAFALAARVPSATAAGELPLIPYEPTLTAGLAMALQLGGHARPAGLPAHVRPNRAPVEIAVVEHAELVGRVVDDAGQPVVGAVVTVKLRAHTATGVTGSGGEVRVAQIPIGRTVAGRTALDDTAAEVAVAVTGKRPAALTLALTRGRNELPPLVLEPLLPPGEVKALVSAAASGRVIAGATVTIEPGGFTAASGPDGKVAIRVPPGSYKITAAAPGYKPQTLELVLDANGVALKNFELARR
jgi:hypothetical protein